MKDRFVVAVIISLAIGFGVLAAIILARNSSGETSTVSITVPVPTVTVYQPATPTLADCSTSDSKVCRVFRQEHTPVNGVG